jgi:hypothetical protein
MMLGLGAYELTMLNNADQASHEYHFPSPIMKNYDELQ